MHPSLTYELARLRQDELRSEARVVRREPVPIRMRALGPGDRAAIEAAFRRLSLATVRARFLGHVKATPQLFAWIDELDGHDRVAVGASHALTGEPLGLARFIRHAGDPATADAAITVIDGWQRRGVGTALMLELTRRAGRAGIDTLSATTSVENGAARALARRLGACFGRPSGGVVGFEIPSAVSDAA